MDLKKRRRREFLPDVCRRDIAEYGFLYPAAVGLMVYGTGLQSRPADCIMQQRGHIFKFFT
jgi:hypothetical protein